MKTTKRRIRYNYKRFVEHVWKWDDMGIPYGTSDLIRLSKKYDTPIPNNLTLKH